MRSHGGWAGLALVSLAQFVVVLDLTIVNVALPSIQRDLRLSEYDLQWVVDVYILAFGGLLLLGGRAADLFGRRRIFMAGLVVFGLASLWDGLAPTGGQLLAARTVQGIGAAMATPSALSLIVVLFPDGAARHRAMGVWTAAAGGGGAAGVVLGGVLTSTLGWPWVFWINVPLVAAGVALAPRLLPPGRAPDPARLDVAGAVTVTGGVAALVYAIVAGQAGGRGGWTVAAIAAAVVLLGLFVAIERRAPAPLVPFGLLRGRGVLAANGAMLLFAPGVFSAPLLASLLMQQVLGYSSLQAGLAFLPQAVSSSLSALLAGRIVARFGTKRVLVCGLCACAVALLALARVPAHGSYPADLLGPFVLVASGASFTLVPLTLIALRDVPERDTGLAAGLINVTRQISTVIGLAVVVSVATVHVVAGEGDTVLGRPEELASGFHQGFLIAGGSVVAAALLAAVVVPGRDATRQGRFSI